MARPLSRNLTEGNPTKQILGFFFPLLVGVLFQQAYAFIDTIIIGHGIGVLAMAGVGSTGSLNGLITGTCLGMCYGFVIPVAQCFGQSDFYNMKKYTVNAIILSLLLSVGISVVFSLLCKRLLIWSNTPQDILHYANTYQLTLFIGLPIIFLYNVLLGIIRSMGDSRTPVTYMIIGAVLNILLDLLFVLLFKWGVIGSAIATLLAQALAMLLCIRYIVKSDILIIAKDEWRLHKDKVKVLLSLALPVGAQYFITSIGGMVIQIATNGLGSTAVAAVAAASKVSQVFCAPFDALGNTMATYAGQHVGAGILHRIRKGIRSCMTIGTIYSIVVFIFLYFFREPLLTIFVNREEVEVLALAKNWLFYNVLFYMFITIVNCFRFTIQGMGFAKQTMISGIIEMIARFITGLLLVKKIGFLAISIANPVAWVCASIFLIFGYLHYMKILEKKKEMGAL